MYSMGLSPSCYKTAGMSSWSDLWVSQRVDDDVDDWGLKRRACGGRERERESSLRHDIMENRISAGNRLF